MRSLWLDRPAIAVDAEIGDSYDDVVVGAGLTGLVTALLLARAGRSVVVLEARHVGAATTGNTTGKLSLLQGTKYSTMLSHQSRPVVEAYLEGNREGQAWLLRFCADHDVPVQVRDAVTYAADPDAGLRQVRAEHEAASSLGLDVRWDDDLAVPFPHAGGTVLAEQAQLDSMDVLDALVAQVRGHGGTVVEGSRVVSVTATGDPVATLEDGATVRGGSLVVATGTPVLDRGLHFAKLEPMRSYALAFDHDDPPDLMMLSAGNPSRSLRDAPGPGGRRRLLVGGEGHPVGRVGSEQAHVDRLRAWTAEYFPGAVETHAWSAQDYAPHDKVPFVGAMPRGNARILVAGGYDKWGMTNAVAAALTLSAMVLRQDRPPWAEMLASRGTSARGALEVARINAEVALYMSRGLLGAELRSSPSSDQPEGAGAVGRSGVVPVGRATTGGRSCSVVALCTHLGGTLAWNDAERSWDCPLHGSRFTADGEVLEGPATRPLRRP
jgi:glycine/D-amino acid oxidase-like deaminating enzyme/nitrite reductase/ring-hydroxylating ferredoxin subunit